MAKKQNWFQKTFSSFAQKAALNIPFISSITGRYMTTTQVMMRREFLKEYKNWVYACVSARAEEVGAIKLQLFKGDEIIDEHPVLDLLQKVNPSMTKHELFFATQAFKDLDGNAFWYLAREGADRQGDIQAIYPLRPDRVQIVQSKDNPLEVEGYTYTQPDGQRVPFSPIEILHFKGFNPLGYHPFPHRGMGVVEAAAWSVDTDNEARVWNYNFFKNSARPDGILTTAGDAAMDDAEYQRLRDEWNTAHGSSDNAHKVAILSGGMTWTEISRTQKDMDFVNQRTFSRDEILSLFRVPKSIIGITDDVNRANADAAIYVFALRTVKPLMQQVVDTLNEFLLPEFGDDLELSFESPVAEDRKASLDEYEAGISGGWMTINEVREREGLPPLLTGGDSLYLPLNVQPVGDVAPEKQTAPKAAKPTKKSKKAAGKKSVAEEAVEKLVASKKHVAKMPPVKKPDTIAKMLTDIARSKYLELWMKTLRINAAPLEKKLNKYFSEQEAEVLANAREVLKSKALMRKALADDLLFNSDEAETIGISLITPFLEDYIKQSGKNASELIGLVSFDPNSDALGKFIQKRAQFFAKTINDTTSEALLTSIKEGLDSGETLSQIEERIGNVYDIAKGSRTQMIARTEISAASNQGALAAYTQGGVEKIQWAVVDPKDEDCLENDGDIEVIGDAFPSGDTEPPVHPNCECTTVPVFD